MTVGKGNHPALIIRLFVKEILRKLCVKKINQKPKKTLWFTGGIWDWFWDALYDLPFEPVSLTGISLRTIPAFYCTGPVLSKACTVGDISTLSSLVMNPVFIG